MAYGPVDLGQQGTKMKIIFVRHGEPDYSMLDKLENPQLYSGFGRDLAPLTGKGRSLAKEVAKTACFGKAEIIISSSVTRALETAHYIAVETGLDLFVEPFFHEWRPDLDGTGCVKASILAAVKENYQVSVDLSAVGVANQKKFKKTLHKWHSVGVIVEGELS